MATAQCSNCGQREPLVCCGKCYCGCLCRADEYPAKTYTLADLWEAFETGAKEVRANGGNPSDELISKSADAYCKLVYHHDWQRSERPNAPKLRRNGRTVNFKER